MADRAEGRLFGLFVLPAWEERGLGTALLEEAEAWLWGHGVEQAWLSTEPGLRAAAFYRRRGWEFEEPYYEDEEKLIKRRP